MSEITDAEVEARIDGIGGLVNIHHAITGKYCPRHLALGMATSAVSALRSERDSLRSALQEAREEGVGKAMYLTVARQVIGRILEADANCDPPHDVDLRTAAIISERDRLRAQLSEAQQEIERAMKVLNDRAVAEARRGNGAIFNQWDGALRKMAQGPECDDSCEHGPQPTPADLISREAAIAAVNRIYSCFDHDQPSHCVDCDLRHKLINTICALPTVPAAEPGGKKLTGEREE